MSVGFIMLCHTALGRAAQVARHWADHGCPVVIHVDSRISARSYDRLVRALADMPNVRFSKRYVCEWGTWGVVAATQSAATLLLQDFPAVSHVYLASGSCLPLRPVAELVRYLDERPQTDFIESVTTEDVEWTVGGLDRERFTLHFPFSWRKNRKLFDVCVQLQRQLGLQRRVPAGLVSHMGSQWWCLTRKTLSAILEDPFRGQHDRYFRKVWIPDESYFQTLARVHSRHLESHSLTLSKFDFQGKPHIFYDDHLQLLRRSDCFVARKIWPHADKLYRSFLSPEAAGQALADPNPGKIDRLFSQACERRTRGRPGLYMQSRHPNPGWENGRTAAPYSVFEGFSDLIENFAPWLAAATGMRIHGNLFAPDRVQFYGGEAVFAGGLSNSAAIRDYNERSFLTSLIWNTRGERQGFQFGPRDRQQITPFLASDPNAQVSVISGAWVVPLCRSDRSAPEKRRDAAQLQKIERDHLALLRASSVRAQVRVWTLAEFIENPMEPLQTIIGDIDPHALHRLTEAPRLVDLTGLRKFLQTLRNEGLKPVLVGDISAGSALRPPPARRKHSIVFGGM